MKETITIITLENMVNKCENEESCFGGCNQPSKTVCKDCYCVECTKHTCKPVLPKGWRYRQ